MNADHGRTGGGDTGGYTRAIARRPGANLGRGLTTSRLDPPDHGLALAQFDGYVRALENCGLTVTVLDPLPEHPDAHFVEDTAVIVPELAVIARPGADSRRDEARHVAPVLARHRDLVRIEAPGILDGGDVLLAGRRALIGISERTNEAGARQLGAALAAHGYDWRPVPVAAGLHLKSSVNAVGNDLLLMTAEFADLEALAGYDRIVVDEKEANACNTLLVNGRLLTPAGYPETRRRLDALAREIVELDTSEFRKMDGGLSCLSLRF